MKVATKRSLPLILALGFVVGGGGVAFASVNAPAGVPDKAPRAVSTSPQPALLDHPECHSARKDDPKDDCYKSIGPWNSTKLSADQVRREIPLTEMVSAKIPAKDIQRYYPGYQP